MTSWVSRYQKGKTSPEARDYGGFGDGSGISWTIRKQSAPRSRQITTPPPYQLVFAGGILFLTPNQRYQCVECKWKYIQRPKTLSTSVRVVRLLCRMAISKVLRTFSPPNRDWYQRHPRSPSPQAWSSRPAIASVVLLAIIRPHCMHGPYAAPYYSCVCLSLCLSV